MTDHIQIKKKIHAKCLELAQGKIDVCNDVLLKIDEAKKAETKSSAGDKFETSREVLQAEEDRATATLSNAMLLKKSLSQIKPERPSIKVEPGALIVSSTLSFYISVGLGKINVDDQIYWAISLASPIAKQMIGKTKGNVFSFNGKDYSITNIF